MLEGARCLKCRLPAVLFFARWLVVATWQGTVDLLPENEVSRAGPASDEGLTRGAETL
jgi:hypothetical protein